jgi:hypothetical protein
MHRVAWALLAHHFPKLIATGLAGTDELERSGQAKGFELAFDCLEAAAPVGRDAYCSSEYGFARLKHDSYAAGTSQIELSSLADDLRRCSMNESSGLIFIPKIPIPCKSVLVGILIQVTYRIKRDS